MRKALISFFALSVLSGLFFPAQAAGKAADEAFLELYPGNKVPKRTLHFPKRMGKLYVLKVSADCSFNRQRPIGDAFGIVEIPANTYVLLDVSYEGLQNVSFFKYLKANDLEAISLANDGSGYSIGDNVMGAISHLTGLRYLNIEQSDISDKGIGKISGFKELRSLNVSHSLVTPRSAKIVGTFSKLYSLEMDGLKIDDRAIADLAGLKELRSGFFRGGVITAAGVKSMKDWNKLIFLRLTNNKFGDAGAASLPVMNNIFELNVENCELTDIGFQSLPKYSTLTKLFAKGNKIGVSGISHLAKCKSLNFLDISGEPLAMPAVQGLKQIKSLRTVIINVVPGTESLAVKNLPGIEVRFPRPRVPLEFFEPLSRKEK